MDASPSRLWSSSAPRRPGSAWREFEPQLCQEGHYRPVNFSCSRLNVWAKSQSENDFPRAVNFTRPPRRRLVTHTL